jgi:hypothetical protein
MNPLDQTTTETRIAERINTGTVQTIGTSSNGGLAFNDASQMMEFAKMMAVAQVAVPKHLRNSPGACLAVCIQASEWQMSPFAVANKSYSVNDRLAYEAQLINAVILKRAPIRGRFKIDYSGDGVKRKCKVSATLTDGEVVEYESPEIGSITVKNSPLWKSDPDQQLFYFSSRSMCRRHFPDVMLGVYTPDDIMEIEPRDVTPKAEASKLFRPKTPTVEDCPQPPVYKSLAQSETADSPHEKPRDGSSVVTQNESAAFSLDGSEVPLVEQVTAKLASAGLKWSEVHAVMVDNGLADPEFVPMNEAPSDVLASCLAQFDAIVNIVKGVKL